MKILHVSEQKETVDEILVNAISDLLQYTPTSKMGDDPEEVRRRKIAAIKVLSDNWNKELMIEYIWAAIRDETDIEVKKKLIDFIITKRELKAFPRLFRFCQIGAIPNQLQRSIAQRFVTYYDHFKDEVDEAEDLDHAIKVLGKTLMEKDTQSIPLAIGILTSYEARSIIPKILQLKIRPKVLKEIIWAIARTETGVITLFTKVPASDHVDKVLMELAETLLLNHSKAPHNRVTIDPTFSSNWSQFIDLPPPIQYLISKARTVHSSVQIRIHALKLLVELQGMVLTQMRDSLENLSSHDLQIIDDIHEQELYFEAVQLPAISSMGLKRIFAEKRFKGILGKYDLSKAFNGDLSQAESIDLELLRRLEELNLLREIPFLDSRQDLVLKVDPLDKETSTIVRDYMDDEDFDVLKSFLDSIEYSLLTILEHHRLLTSTVEQLIEGSDFGKDAILEAFYSDNLPESFTQDPKKPFILQRYLTAEIIRQTMIDVAMNTSTEELRGIAFEMLQKPEFWYSPTTKENNIVRPGGFVASFQVLLNFLSKGAHLLKIESKRQIREKIFLSLIGFLELLKEIVEELPAEGESYEFPFSQPLFRHWLAKARPNMEELRSHYLGNALYFIYYHFLTGNFPKLDTSMKYPALVIPHLINFYFLGLNGENGRASMDYLLSSSAIARQNFLRLVDELADNPQELLPLNVNAIISFLDRLVTDKEPAIRTKARFLLNKLTGHKVQ